MKEINLTVYTVADGDNKVTMTAAFDTHEEAVRYHNEIAKIAVEASKPLAQRNQWGGNVARMLGHYSGDERKI